jgi:hypothetical protein
MKLIIKEKTLKDVFLLYLHAGYSTSAALDLIGIKPYIPDQLDKSSKAFILLKEAIKIINEGWYPDWNNESEYKYWNYFNMKGVFSYSRTDGWFTNTYVPSALIFKSKSDAIEIGKLLLNTYKDYYQ